MKKQYLGDSKDSFKWDYHDFLTSELGYPVLNIFLMMTPDDDSSQGKSKPTLFRARSEIIGFCTYLRKEKNIDLINELPARTRGEYRVNLHKPEVYFSNRGRRSYFQGVSVKENQVVFLDPDNGMQPEKNCSNKHVSYADISELLRQITSNSVISVFQHFRRIPFVEDFRNIQSRLSDDCFATALYWNFLMFVIISRSKETIAKVKQANSLYAANKPLTAI